MTFRVWSLAVWLAMGLGLLGCDHASGRPGPGPQVLRPEQQLDFATLYKTNCAGCHGDKGNHGAAIALSNSVYLAFAGEAVLKEITAKGVPGTLMPAFAKSAGGVLTDQQVTVLAHGMIESWGNPSVFTGQTPPAYKVTLSGDAVHGQQQFAASCASCHGANGVGSQKGNGEKVGSIVDPSYLALVSDQALRSVVVAGLPDSGMPDWRSDAATSMTDQQVTDVVAWLASLRGATAGEPHPMRP